MPRDLENCSWKLERDAFGKITWDQIQVGLLQDIRAELQSAVCELKQINSTLGCNNTRDIPHILRGIRAKLPVRKKRKRSLL